MKFIPQILRPISQFTTKRRQFHTDFIESRVFVDHHNISNEVLNIIETITPMEPTLEKISNFITPLLVTSIIQQQQNPQLNFRFLLWASQKEHLRKWACLHLMVDMILVENGFNLYWKLLEDLKSFRVSIPSHAFWVLVWGYMKLGMVEKAVESFGRMRDFDCKPDVLTYNGLLHVVMKKGVVLLGLAVYNMMLKSNCDPDLGTYSALIDGLNRNAMIGDAIKMFDEMTQRGVNPDRFVYTMVISGLCRVNMTNDACKVLNMMRLHRCFPDSATYNALLDGFCKLGRMDDALELLREFQDAGYVLGIAGYSSLIEGFFKAGRLDEAHDWYRRMFEDGIEPDLILYTIMIRGLCNDGRVNDAVKLFSEMRESGLVPDTWCYNTLIKGFCDMGLLDEAQSLKLEISSNDCFPDRHTYTILICGMCKNGLVEDARKIFDDMEKLGIFPSVVTFNTLIDGLCKAGELEEARLLFYKMEIGRNPSLFLRLSQGTDRVLDRASLETLVERLCESGLILKAYKILMQLVNNGVTPDTRTYNILINGLCTANNINGALKLFKELQLKGLSPDSVTYGTLMNGLQKVGREDDAFGVFDQMVKNGVEPTPGIYNSLMSWSCRKGKVLQAFSLWLKYLKSLPDCELEMLESMERHFERGEVEKAVGGLLEMGSNLTNLKSSPYSIWLIGFCQAGRVDEALKIFSLLVKCQRKVTPASCVMLIRGLRKEQNLEVATNVFLFTLEKGMKLKPQIVNQLIRSLLHAPNHIRHAFDLVSKMKDVGYDLDTHLFRYTKFLLRDYWNTIEMESLNHG